MQHPNLYQKDFQAWISQQTDLLKSGRFEALDVSNLLEEMEDMGKSNRRALASHLVILLAHLLKWRFQPEYRGKSWKSSIVEQRFQIQESLAESPSLQASLHALLEKAYPKAVKLARQETGFPSEHFPSDCPFSWEQLLDEQFYPVAPDAESVGFSA